VNYKIIFVASEAKVT